MRVPVFFSKAKRRKITKSEANFTYNADKDKCIQNEVRFLKRLLLYWKCDIISERNQISPNISRVSIPTKSAFPLDNLKRDDVNHDTRVPHNKVLMFITYFTPQLGTVLNLDVHVLI